MPPSRPCSGLRSIPACAGAPVSLWKHAPGENTTTVYPRVCGGTFMAMETNSRHTGLSPRVRGHPYSVSSLCNVGRSIPACAGAPAMAIPSRQLLTVYPRVCGGTRLGRTQAVAQVGSIPACAGAPVKHAPGENTTTVYPRVCGGTLPMSTSRGPALRSIPACAGAPRRGPWLLKSIQVYPRVCGGTPLLLAALRFLQRVYPRVCGGTCYALPV